VRFEKQAQAVKILERVIRQLVLEAKKESPVEACGYLAAKNGVITYAYALTNIDASSEHFSFDPKEQFAALRNIRLRGLEICAAYHSHPASPAWPSLEDIKLAHDPGMLYVIISLVENKEDVRAFKIINQKAQAVSLEVVVDENI